MVRFKNCKQIYCFPEQLGSKFENRRSESESCQIFGSSSDKLGRLVLPEGDDKIEVGMMFDKDQRKRMDDLT